MLNVKKLLVINAVLFGLFLSNTIVAAAVEEVPMGSTFLNSIHIEDYSEDPAAAKETYDALAGVIEAAYGGGFDIINYENEVRFGADDAQLGILLGHINQDFAAIPYPFDVQDRNTFKIFAHNGGEVDDALIAALRAVYPIEAMPETELNLRILLFTVKPPEDEADFDYIEKLAEIRAAIDAYHEAHAAIIVLDDSDSNMDD